MDTGRIDAVIEAIDSYVDVYIQDNEYETGVALRPLTEVLSAQLSYIIEQYSDPQEQAYWPAQMERILDAIEAGDRFLVLDSLIFEAKANLLLLKGEDISDPPQEQAGRGASFDANLSALRERHAEAAQIISGTGSDQCDAGVEETGSEQCDAGVEETGSEQCDAGVEEIGSDQCDAGVEEIGGRSVLYAVSQGRGYQLDSMYSSVPILELWQKNLRANYDSRIVMFGLGNGMFAKKALELLSDRGLLIVYEPDASLLRFVMERFDLRSVFSDPRFILILPETEDVRDGAEKDLYYIMADNVQYTDMDGLRITAYPGYERIFSEKYRYFDDRTWEVVGSMKANRSVLARFGADFVKNDLANYVYLADSLDLRDLDLPEGVAGIVVSSGPSLNKNIEQLKKAKGRALIAAADSAVSVLLGAGIEPDIFFCVDARKNPGHFADPAVADLILGCDLDATRIVFKGRRAPCFFGYARNPHVRAFLEDRGLNPPELKGGGSVAHTAVSFLLELGVRTIILVGQDLAYTGDKSHAAGSLRSTWNLDLSKNECYVEGIDGKPVRSSSEFVTYRNWFERRIQSETGVRFINATEGGARIHGAEEMTLEAAIELCCRQDFDGRAFLLGARPLMDPGVRQEFMEYMSALESEIDKLSTLIRDTLRMYEEMLRLARENKYSNQRFKKLYSRSGEVSGELEGNPCMYYVECMVQQEMTEVMDRPQATSGDTRRDLLDALANGRDYYDIVKKGADMVLSCIRGEQE